MSSLRNLARFAVLFGALALACSSATTSIMETADGGSSPDSGPASDAASDAGSNGESDSGAVSDGATPEVACTNPPNCLHRFPVPNTSFTLPYYSTFPIDQANAEITRIVVFNQGLDRDADTDFSTMVTAAQMANADGSTLVVTPHFEALVSAGGAACTGHADTPLATDLVWTCDAWSDGLAAANDPNVTSYGVLDALLARVITTFPHARVVVSGFSAGGQLTQRYVAVNQVDPGAGGAFRYVVGDPSSYLYFDDRRPANASNCTLAGCPDGFPELASDDVDGGCPNFNDWKYGTDALVGAAASLTPAELEAAYLSRNVTYLLGTLDNAATTAAHYSELDITCPAEAEGPFRYQRGLAFFAYAATLDAGPSTLAPVTGCAHSPSCVFQSDAGIAAVFGD